MWNPLMDLIFHEQISGAFVPSVDEIDLAKVALSCHFALDLLCCKVCTILHDASFSTIAVECIHYGTALSTRRKGSNDLWH